jgi:hypothetical protein
MSDAESDSITRESQLYGRKWVAGYALNGLSICKDLHCLCGDKKIGKGALRIGRRYPSPFDEGSIAINWFHAKCIFNQQRRSRVGTQIIGGVEDIDGIENLLLADRDLIEELIEGNIELIPEKSTKENHESEKGNKQPTIKTANSVKKAPKKSGGNERRVSINRRDQGRVLMM